MTREEAIEQLKQIPIHDAVSDNYIKSIYEAIDMAIKALEQEPCGDAISRQAVLNAMYELCDTGETLKENPWRDNPHIDGVVEAIEELPSVTPQQRTGRWIKQNYGWNWQCSECGFVTPPSAKEIFTFCPNCGVKMEVE